MGFLMVIWVMVMVIGQDEEEVEQCVGGGCENTGEARSIPARRL